MSKRVFCRDIKIIAIKSKNSTLKIDEMYIELFTLLFKQQLVQLGVSLFFLNCIFR